MKKAFALAVLGMLIGADLQAGFFNDVVKVATAPVKAVEEVASDVSKGKTPSLEKVVKAASPAVAVTVEADKQLKVTETLREVRDMPKNANEATKSIKRTSDEGRKTAVEARNLMAEAKESIAELNANLSAALGKFAPPALVLLWGLVALVGIKIVKALLTGRAPAPTR